MTMHSVKTLQMNGSANSFEFIPSFLNGFTAHRCLSSHFSYLPHDVWFWCIIRSLCITRLYHTFWVVCVDPAIFFRGCVHFLPWLGHFLRKQRTPWNSDIFSVDPFLCNIRWPELLQINEEQCSTSALSVHISVSINRVAEGWNCTKDYLTSHTEVKNSWDTKLRASDTSKLTFE